MTSSQGHSLSQQHNNIDKSILKLYKKPFEYLMVNDRDPDLHPVKIPLPIPPPIETIDGYGLHPREQFFVRQKYPSRLKQFERSCKTIDEIHEKLDKHREDYIDELKWIEKQWERRLNGYWFFINGRPTYIDGWHYVYLNFWELDIGLPEYRNRDWKFFHFARFCYKDTMAFYNYRVVVNKRDYYFSTPETAEKFALSNSLDFSNVEEGEYYVDTKRRVCFGFNYPKHRREGATSRSECINYCIISQLENAKGGIQSMTGASAKKIFLDHLIKPWKRMPFFFKPMYDGSTNPKSELVFDIPTIRVGGRGSLANIDSGLQSLINFAETAGRGYYDGDKLYFLHNDEEGKTTEEYVHERWMVQKKCLSQGNGLLIHGLSISTSTVGEMEKQGGKSYLIHCKDSHYHIRNSIGQTLTGMYNLFIPADEGLEGFIDVFGESIIDDPEESDLWRIPNPVRDANGNLVGARRYILEQREHLLMRDDVESMEAYEEEVRLHPLYFAECFITSGSGAGLNLKKITKRIKELQFDDTQTKRVDFEWRDGIKDGKVVLIDNPVSGKYVVSKELSQQESNRKYYKKLMLDGKAITQWYPDNNWFVACGDAYLFQQTRSSRMSFGAGSVFYRYDPRIDDGKPIDEWESYRTVCTYLNRPRDPDEYAEDMLKMCVYWGCGMFPEINVPLIWNYFVRRGYGGFLLYERTPDGRYKSTPGFYARGANQQQIFQKHQQFIEKHSNRERHIEILLQCKNIKGIEELKDYDLFVAVGGAYLADEICFFIDETKRNVGIYSLNNYFSKKRI